MSEHNTRTHRTSTWKLYWLEQRITENTRTSVYADEKRRVENSGCVRDASVATCSDENTCRSLLFAVFDFSSRHRWKNSYEPQTYEDLPIGIR